MGPALVAPADVTVDAEVAQMFTHVVGTWGRGDLLVNNAGTFGPAGEIDPQDWRRTIGVNLTGAFLCAHHAVRTMKQQDPRGGRLINNGSTFDPTHVAEAVVQMARLPLGITVPWMTIVAIGMLYGGRG